MDAFGTAHRAQGSTHGVAKFAKVACAGPLLAAELDALGKALDKPQRPMVAIVAGSKVSTKLDVLTSLADICDQLIVGGGIANTFLAAAGYKVGKSLQEADLIDTAKAIAAKVAACRWMVVAKEFAESAEATVKAIADVADDDMILDIGPKTAAMFGEMLKSSQTILWNGPVGVFEFDQFGNGTKVLAQAIAQSPAFSIAGGGDTLAAIDKYGVAEQISYISTGGGAFLEFVEGRCCRRSRYWSNAPADGRAGCRRRPRRWQPADADGNPGGSPWSLFLSEQGKGIRHALRRCCRLLPGPGRLRRQFAGYRLPGARPAAGAWPDRRTRPAC